MALFPSVHALGGMRSSSRGGRAIPWSSRRWWCLWVTGLVLLFGYFLAVLRAFNPNTRKEIDADPKSMVRKAQYGLFSQYLPRPIPRPMKGLDGVKITVVSWEPRIIVADNFITDEEVAEAIDTLKDVGYSGTGLVSKSGGASQVDIHTVSSKIAFYPVSRDKRVEVQGGKESQSFADRITVRIARLAQLPASHGEPMFTLSYAPGEFFRGHLDAHAYEGRFTTSRVATVLVYLTDVPEGTGGETFFPLAHPLPFEKLRDEGFTEDVSKVDSRCLQYGQKDDKVQTQAERDKYEDGSDLLPQSNQKPGPGLMVRSRKGRAILWWNRLPSGDLDLLSRHAGCPLTEGTKKTLTKWLHYHSCDCGACSLLGYPSWAAMQAEKQARKMEGGMKETSVNADPKPNT